MQWITHRRDMLIRIGKRNARRRHQFGAADHFENGRRLANVTNSLFGAVVGLAIWICSAGREAQATDLVRSYFGDTSRHGCLRWRRREQRIHHVAATFEFYRSSDNHRGIGIAVPRDGGPAHCKPVVPKDAPGLPCRLHSEAGKFSLS